MSALIYLLSRKLKNNIISVFKSPAKLISAIILVALIGFSAFSSAKNPTENIYGLRDINELYALIFLVYSIIFVLISKNGFYNGASMFSMADVNMIFTSPVRQNKVLSFGLFQQLGRSLMIGYFIIFQASLLKETYGITFAHIIYILTGYGLTVFFAQMAAMIFYSLTSADDKLRAFVKGLYFTFIGFFASFVLFYASRIGGITIENLVRVSRSLAIRVFPVSGITSLAVEGAIEGTPGKVIIGLAFCIVFWAVYRFGVTLINADYYEDVLQSTEISYSAIQARKEGKAAETAPRNIKTGKTGINKGFGASVIAYKHKIENRRGRVFLLSTMSLVMIGVSVAGCLLMGNIPIGIFALNVYMLTMGVVSGRWGKELSYPYIYLIPEKPHIKLWYTLKGEFPSLIAESILCFIPAYFIVHLTLAETIGMILGRISFGLLFISVNLLLQKLFGTSEKKVLVLMVYLLLILLFSAPGILAGVFIAMFYPFSFSLAYPIMSAVNIAVAAILAFSCRNILKEI